MSDDYQRTYAMPTGRFLDALVSNIEQIQHRPGYARAFEVRAPCGEVLEVYLKQELDYKSAQVECLDRNGRPK